MGYACKLSSNAQVHTDTYTVTDDGTYDMGIMHKYRYANLKKNHTATYTVPNNGTADMGVNHSYRYVTSGSRITTLGSANSDADRTFSAAAIPGWNSLNLNNFKVQVTSMTSKMPCADSHENGPVPTSYNAGNAILSCKKFYINNPYHNWFAYFSYTVYVTY